MLVLLVLGHAVGAPVGDDSQEIRISRLRPAAQQPVYMQRAG